MPLKIYKKKRNFSKTPEPKGKSLRSTSKNLYIIQKHAASHLHYDFRLELNGVLLSWAVPKGPCLDPKIKRLAVHTEDHPIEYGSFEGIIPKGQYGGGTVMLWDKGKWICEDKNPVAAYKKGHLTFTLKAKKLNGKWMLIRINQNDKTWLLMKVNDEYSQPLKKFDITIKEPNSVISQQSINEISENYKKIWGKEGLVKNKKEIIKNKKEIISKTKSAKKKLSIKNKKKVNSKIKIDLPKKPFPNLLKPELATLVDKPPEGKEWVHEIKFDGYRLLIYKRNKKVTIYTRNNNDWTHKFKLLAQEISQLPVKNLILDGEVVVLDEHQHSNFQLLQNSIKEGNADFIYYAFDLLYYDEFNLLTSSLLERKNILENLIKNNESDLIKYSDHVFGSGKKIFAKSCKLGLEGIVSKNIQSEYSQKRDTNWLKSKCIKRQEFVIGGYLPSQRREHFRSLMLGTFNKNGELNYHGNVGTGFTEASLQSIHKLLSKYKTAKMPFVKKPAGSKDAVWLKPIVVAEVEFTEWTNDLTLRHPSFKGIRNDKPANKIIKEEEMTMENVKNKKSSQIKNQKKEKQKKEKQKNEMQIDNEFSYRLTHPNKILYPEDKITKQEIAEYYETVQQWILPYISNRLLTLVRCPNDYKKCFYQKHIEHAASGLFGKMVKDKEKKSEYFYLKDEEGLMALPQLGILEIHPWGSCVEHIEHPDMIIFDLDPAPGVAWKKIVEAANEIKTILSTMKLKSFIKTTGGKGLHVVIPIQPEYKWDEIKNFSHLLVDYLVMQHPKDYIGKMTKSARTNKIYLDYLRNQRGATAIAPYSTRSRIHAPVATPIHWDELSNDIRDVSFNIKTIPQRLQNLKKDPWKDFFKVKQSLDLKKFK